VILRRLTTALRKQDWVTVVIETLIVVLGVFLGVQIGNWNQSGQQQRLFDESFDRAIVEIQSNLAEIEASRGTIAARIPIVQLAIEDLRACRTGDAAKTRIEAAFAPVRALNGFDLDTKALDQLINNDGFLPYQTPEMRKRLMALSTRLNLLHTNSIDMGDSHKVTYQDVSHIVRPGPLTFEGPEQAFEAIRGGAIASGEIVRKQALVVPLDVACRDEAFLGAFYSWENAAYYHWIMGKFAAEAIRNDLEALDVPASKTEGDAP
jgi:hypothetical protein